MAALILVCYTLLASLLLGPLCLAVRRHPNFQGTLRRRLSLDLPQRRPGDLLWVHAASLGEVKAVSGLIAALKARRPDITICLTAMTATGRQAAGTIPGVDLVLPMPFDLPWIMRRYLRHLSPQALIIVETEIWPNLLTQASKAGVRTLFVNARLSEKAFQRYQWIAPLTRALFRGVEVLAMDAADAERFQALGAPQVRTLGNLKFDAMRAADPARAQTVRASLNCGGRPVFIAGSVREGEEAMVMDAIRQARSRIPDLFAIIAPRHAERIPLIRELAKDNGLACSLRSQPGPGDLLIIDTVGELFDLYGAAQAAFVGGSLVDLGGQNILEPIAWGVPTIHGPHMQNFTWALAAVQGHTIIVHDAHELGEQIAAILTQPERFHTIATEARKKLDAARGGTERYVNAILGRE